MDELEQLNQLGEEFDRQPRCNPPRASCDVFEAFLLERGIDPNSFSRETWWRYLEMRGLNEDEIVNYLQGAAEWLPKT
jgi:hypothetical protein